MAFVVSCLLTASEMSRRMMMMMMMTCWKAIEVLQLECAKKTGKKWGKAWTKANVAGWGTSCHTPFCHATSFWGFQSRLFQAAERRKWFTCMLLCFYLLGGSGEPKWWVSRKKAEGERMGVAPSRVRIAVCAIYDTAFCLKGTTTYIRVFYVL